MSHGVSFVIWPKVLLLSAFRMGKGSNIILKTKRRFSLVRKDKTSCSFQVVGKERLFYEYDVVYGLLMNFMTIEVIMCMYCCRA